MDKASQDIISTVPEYIFVHLESKTVQTSCRILSGLLCVVGIDKSKCVYVDPVLIQEEDNYSLSSQQNFHIQLYLMQQ